MKEFELKEQTATEASDAEPLIVQPKTRIWPWVAAGVALAMVVPLIAVYVHYYRVVGAKLHSGLFSNASNIYAAPRTLNAQPELITNMTADDREKRRMVEFRQIPPVLIHAVVSAEDKRFFEHMGFDPRRLVKAAYIDLKDGKKEQGASTITMQLARGFWLDPEKRWRRKARELIITTVLEQRLTKQQIFQHYANEVYLGRQNTFSIHGFGEAARVYFNKDIAELSLPQAALLAGLIQRPSYFNPFRYPERAKERRNTVLKLMHQNRFIDAADYAQAIAAPLGLSPAQADRNEYPYFLALVNDELQSRVPDNEAGYQVYTTLDVDLQRAAVEAVHAAMPKVDKVLMGRRRAKTGDSVLPQVALIALDPHTGEVRAAVGGRDYGLSQLNHTLSMRQPGSVFKPLVYAAALNTGVEGGNRTFTEYSTLQDQPTTFTYGNQTYQPANFEHQFYGTVSLRRALAHSMNVATVSLAQQVGFDRVVALARMAGLNEDIKPTPAVALGAYEATPLEMAGAYTVFANQGTFVRPTFLREVRTPDGITVVNGSTDQHRALDPRVAFLMRDMLEEVMRSGTAAGVRGLGFNGIAAGKTGTSRDGWFAGFTPDLLCIVWVGFDDNRELNIEGAKSALPVWAEFMKRAAAIHPSKRTFPPPPQGIVSARVDPESGQLAGPYCPNARGGYFIDGTQPQTQCTLHPGPGDLFLENTADRAAPIPVAPTPQIP